MFDQLYACHKTLLEINKSKKNSLAFVIIYLKIEIKSPKTQISRLYSSSRLIKKPQSIIKME